jgi:hypothetical protein
MTLNHTLRPCKRSPTSLTQLENGASKSTLFSVHKKVNKRKEKDFKITPWFWPCRRPVYAVSTTFTTFSRVHLTEIYRSSP